MLMSQPREHDFADELAALIARYADVPRGCRGAYLMTAIAALIQAEKGDVPTVKEFGDCIMALMMKVADQGQVRMN